MPPVKSCSSGLKLRVLAERIHTNQSAYVFKRILFLVIFIILVSVLNYCGRPIEKTYTDVHLAPVPYIPTWHTTFNASAQDFKFGYVVEAGFDLDNNGHREFAAFDTLNNRLVIFENVGNNQFEYKWNYKFPASVQNSKQLSVTTGDLNSDGVIELIVIADLVNYPGILIWQHSSDSSRYLTDNPLAKFDPPRDYAGKIYPATESLVSDFDNDDKDELLILYNGNTKFLMTIGSLKSKPWEALGGDSLNIEYADYSLATHDTLKVAGIGIGDVDHNGNQEIVIICEGIKAPIRLYSYINGKYKLVKSWELKEFPMNYTGSSANIPIVDFNNDGNLEAYLLSNPNPLASSGPALVWVVELGTDLTQAFNAQNFTPIVSLDNTTLRGGVVGDGDRDGQPDIYALGIDNGALYQIEFTSNRDSTITNNYNYVPYKIYQPRSIAIIPTNISDVQDLDGDGRNEIVVVRGKRLFQIPMRNPALPAPSDDVGVMILENSGIVAPSHLISQKTPDGEVKLSWKDNAENETNFKIVLDDGMPPDDLVNDHIGKDVRHFFHTTPPEYNENLEYRVIAFNSDTHLESDKSNGIQIPTILEAELSVQHANGLAVGNLGGSGSGWADFLCTTSSGIIQDVIYDGYLLLWSKPVSAGAGSKIYSKKSAEQFKPHHLNTKIGLIKYSSYEKTTALGKPYHPVLLQTTDDELIMAQVTFHKPGSRWVLSWWAVKNVSSSSRWLKLALHLDVDTGGELSKYDYGKKNETLKMIYQENHDSHKTVGLAHIINDLDLTDIDLGDLGKAQTNRFGSFDAQNLLDNARANMPPYFDLVTGDATDIEMTLVSDLGAIEKDKFRMVFFAIATSDNPAGLSDIENAKKFFKDEILKKIPISIDTPPDTGYFLLDNTFANSSDPNTLLNYRTTEEPLDITLKISNIFGDTIKELVYQNLSIGGHSIKWNGKDLNNNTVPAGIYIYILKSEPTP